MKTSKDIMKKGDSISKRKYRIINKYIQSFKIHKHPKKNKNKLKIFINTILVCIILCSLGILGFHKYSNYRTVRLYLQLADDVMDIKKQTDSNILHTTTSSSTILPQYETLYKQNHDLIGWISIDGTNINFPVMYTKDPDYYARRNFKKEFTDYGSIWMDENNTLAADKRDNNLLIYGHNIWQENTMFSALHGYEEESFYKSHPNIHFDSIYEEGTYDVIAAVRTEVLMSNHKGFRYYYFRGYHTKNEYNEYMQFLSQNKLYDTGIWTSYGDELITLSTCSRHVSGTSGRFIVVAKRRK